MAYTSLYRKYRPDTFDKVIGQDHIVKTLTNQIKNDNVGHAYIFTGTRGTGKTSVAKIFAKAVNCLSPVNGSPCLKCEHCLELSSSANFDVIELDAASNNSVDQIRELTDKIGFPPTVGRYKVYIIDEVHMLSTSAFNALLKTLEEPPAHAIFILATTEIHKIPATILSRCLRFDFRLVPSKVIADRIRFIFDDIGAKYEDEAVELIASNGNGSVRDALSIADMCVSYCDNKITYDGVLEVLGASDPSKLRALAKDVLDGNADGALKKVAELTELGKSIPILAKDLAELMRNVLYIKQCSDAWRLISLPKSVFDGLKELADAYPAQKCLNVMKTFSKLEGELRYSSQHRILFEGAIVEACLDVGMGESEQAARILRLEKTLNSLKKSGFNVPPAILDAKQVWVHIASELMKEGFNLLALALKDADKQMSDEEFVIYLPDSATMKIVQDKVNRDALNRAFEATAQVGERKLVLLEKLRLDENKVLPYLKDMFDSTLEVFKTKGRQE